MAKVCGLTTAKDVAMVLAAGADLVGFLHHPPSPRHCPDPALARLAGDRAVRVVVMAEAMELLNHLERSAVGWVQPYLPPAQRAQALSLLKDRGLRVLLPWPDEPEQAPLEADLYLWETSPRDTGLLGGSGQGHAMRFPPPGPFLLGGGLSGPLLRGRLEAMPDPARPVCHGFDAASQLEHPEAVRGPGRKDPDRVRAFVQAAHALALPRPSLFRSEP